MTPDDRFRRAVDEWLPGDEIEHETPPPWFGAGLLGVCLIVVCALGWALWRVASAAWGLS